MAWLRKPRRAAYIPSARFHAQPADPMIHAPFVPLVAVTADVRPSDSYLWHAAPEPYLRGITHGLGGIPVILPSLGEEIDLDALLGRVDGVLLTGSRSNVHPSLYGE